MNAPHQNRKVYFELPHLMVNIRYLISALEDYVFDNLRICTIKVFPDFNNLVAHSHFYIFVSFCFQKIVFLGFRTDQ